jgi:hypothetical protein
MELTVLLSDFLVLFLPTMYMFARNSKKKIALVISTLQNTGIDTSNTLYDKEFKKSLVKAK